MRRTTRGRSGARFLAGSEGSHADDSGIMEDWTQIFSVARANVVLCPPLTGLVILAVVSRVVPQRWHLVYAALGICLLSYVCWSIVRANPHSGPDPTVIFSGLFAQIGWPLSIALVWAQLRRMSLKR